jgi:hypothetical protein
LKKGQKIVFRHQLLIANSPLSHEEINLEQERFSGND